MMLLDINTEMLARDPHGIIMTVTSVSVVFLALLILYLCYGIIGKIVNKEWKILHKRKGNEKSRDAEIAAAISLALKEETSGEVQAVIALALKEHFEEYPHDEESYIITIKR